MKQWRIQGEGLGVMDSTPHPPTYQTRRLQLWDWIWIRSRRCHNLKCSKIKGNFAIQDFHAKPTQLKQSWVPWYCVTNIPLRGHRDDSTSKASKKGNFHAILMLLGNSDKNLKEPLLTDGRNATSSSNCTRGSHSHHWRVCLGESYTAESVGRRFFLNYWQWGNR